MTTKANSVKAKKRNMMTPVAVSIGIVVIGVVVFAIASYQRDIHQARERISSGSQIARTGCGPIEYSVVGDGTPVLVSHAAGGGFDQGLELTKDLVKSGFRVIVPSRFGYLRTPLPADASPAAQADAYACLLDALNIQRAAVIGFSAGAPSSMQFALRYPDRTDALVLVVPAAYPTQLGQGSGNAVPKQTSALTKFLFNTVLKSDFLVWASFRLAPQSMDEVMLATPREVVEKASSDEQARIAQVLENLLPFSQRLAGVSNDASITPFLPRYDLEQIKAPTLILGVTDDLYQTYNGARYSAEHIPNAKLIVYPSGGHALVEHQKDSLSEVVSFLKSLNSQDFTALP